MRDRAASSLSRTATSSYRIATFQKYQYIFKVMFFTHRDMQRYIENNAVTSIVTLNCNSKYRMLKNKALWALLYF